MAIGIDDLDDDDYGMGFEPSELESLEENGQQLNAYHLTDDNDDDLLSDFLKTRGIDDTSRIKFEDDNGNIEERSWDSLTKEEKFNILNTPLSYEEPQDDNLSYEEIQLLNEIRRNNMTPSQYLQLIAGLQQVVLEPQYKIDDLSDDELFLLDLESRVGELSEDDAAQALANSKLNEDLFKKLVDGIRKEYKEREDYLLQLQQAEVEQLRLEAYNQFQDLIISSIGNFESIGNLDLNFDDLDKEELAQFMLSRDEAGNNYLWQALQDPDTLVKAAWFILNGDEALNNVSDYFVNLIKQVSEALYRKGFEEGRNGKLPSRPQVVINKKQQTNHPTISTIDDLDDDD